MKQKLQTMLESFRRPWTPEEAKRWESVCESLGAVYDTEAGKEVLWFLMDTTDPFFSAYTGNSDSYYLAALQDLGRLLAHMLTTVRPYAFAELLRVGVINQNNEGDSDGR